MGDTEARDDQSCGGHHDDELAGQRFPEFEDIIATCRDLDRQDRDDTLVRLPLKKG